ncbi:transporter substrate-binding protein [Bradyrhizobium sp. AZCC 2289]|uniref:transporter substrate-binding protein n=1 Tax=Bradyrhizobium sp. AZCC 2289 TaxID=3117026 RepID=UPI002FF0C591
MTIRSGHSVIAKHTPQARVSAFCSKTALLLAFIVAFLFANRAEAEDTIQVGILHSLSGAMAPTETPLKDAMLMLIDLQNKKGGLLGKKLEAVVVDPASNWPLFAEKARELITKDHVAVVFGCWTAVSLQAVQPVFKELNSILFYPSPESFSPVHNVFFTGGAPNQLAIPAVDYLMKDQGIGRWVLEGTDSNYPRTTHTILKEYLKSKGVADQDISINYTPLGNDNWQNRVAEIRTFSSAGKKTAVVLAAYGDAGAAFYRELQSQGVKPQDVPVLTISMNEDQLPQIQFKPLVGHLIVSNYVQSVESPANGEFIKSWREFTKDPKRLSSAAMESDFIGFAMWVKAVEKVRSTDPDKVIAALPGIEVQNLSGSISRMLPNHHVTKPVFISQIKEDGRISVLSKISDTRSDEKPDCPACPKSGACPQAIAATCPTCPRSGACPQ